MSGNVSLGGTLNVSGLSGFSFASGQTFTFIDASGAVSNTFNTLKYAGYSESGSNILSIGNNLDLEVLYNANYVILEVLAQSSGGFVLPPDQATVYNMLNGLVNNPPSADFSSVMGVIDSMPSSSVAGNALQQISADKVQALSDL